MVIAKSSLLNPIFLLLPGWGKKSKDTLIWLHATFPDDLEIAKELGVSYLMNNQNQEAKKVFYEVRLVCYFSNDFYFVTCLFWSLLTLYFKTFFV